MPRPVTASLVPSRQTEDDRLGAAWVDVLQEVPLFATLTKRHVRRIANAAHQKRFAPKTLFWSLSKRAGIVPVARLKTRSARCRPSSKLC